MSSLGRAAALLMLLLIGLASCSTKPQPLNSDASAKAYIPLNISGWSYTHESMQSVQLHRTWDTHILDAAATGVNPEHLRQLVDKLDSGKPITVVAFGDSITSDFGGCFHSNEQMLRSVVPSLSHVYVNNKCGAFLPPMADVKWLAVFMDFVNHTWPHPNHTLVNLALPGAAADFFARGLCLERWLPRQADLVLVQHLPVLLSSNVGLGMEKLLWRVMQHLGQDAIDSRQRPAFLLLNMFRITDGVWPFVEKTSEEQCIMDQALCDSLCGERFGHNLLPHAIGAGAEEQAHLLAQYYGVISLSHRNMLLAMLGQLREASPAAECHLLSSLYLDRVHPSPLGRLMLVDLLVHQLALAVRHAREMQAAAWPREVPRLALYAKGRHHPQAMNASTSRQHPAVEALLHGCRDMWRMRCYGPLQPTQHSEQDTADVAKEDGQLQRLQVMSAINWSFVDYEVSNGVKKAKPGWVARVPSARLQLLVDSSFTRQEEVTVNLAAPGASKQSSSSSSSSAPVHQGNVIVQLAAPGASKQRSRSSSSAPGGQGNATTQARSEEAHGRVWLQLLAKLGSLLARKNEVKSEAPAVDEVEVEVVTGLPGGDPLKPQLTAGSSGSSRAGNSMYAASAAAFQPRPAPAAATTAAGTSKAGAWLAQCKRYLNATTTVDRLAGYWKPDRSRFFPQAPDRIKYSARVSISHLQSYEGMGSALVRCIAGCWCKPLVLDGHDGSARQSIQVLADVQVTQHSCCLLEVLVMGRSSSKGHKVKVGQVVAKTLVRGAPRVL